MIASTSAQRIGIGTFLRSRRRHESSRSCCLVNSPPLFVSTSSRQAESGCGKPSVKLFRVTTPSNRELCSATLESIHALLEGGSQFMAMDVKEALR